METQSPFMPESIDNEPHPDYLEAADKFDHIVAALGNLGEGLLAGHDEEKPFGIDLMHESKSSPLHADLTKPWTTVMTPIDEGIQPDLWDYLD